MRITPPNTVALSASAVPNFLPIMIPLRHIIIVTAAMIAAHKSAVGRSYSAIVNPTESASMDVAIP